MTSNREHDDSEIRIFTCFCGKGWKSCSKKMLARCAVIRGFNQIEKFLRRITPQNKLYYFSEKKIGGLGAL